MAKVQPLPTTDLKMSTNIVGSVSIPRRSPTRKDGQANLEHIIETATRLLDTYSLANLSFKQVAIEAHIPRTTIYGFFPTLSALLEEVARREIVKSWDFVRRWLRSRPPADLFGLLMANIDASVEYINANPAARKTLLGSGAFSLHILDSEFDMMVAQLYREFCELAWPVKALSEADPFRTIVLLQTAIFSSSVQRHDQVTPVMKAQAKIVAERFFGPLVLEFGEPLMILERSKTAEVPTDTR